ncbi:FUSC family protein [Spirosoma sordidisoli]|uniref:Uncharacterized protein n=1 Tax=Spirosoma sordidisoli TaxID=2502893 RepID=A0A4Q2UN88_9BACT|nr:FUSC family membrane protein [Spirosoma sordidisoli]RYC70786.1 hypothetical protein EQG79_01140 [Spirosoma sordidisoli]
MNRRIREIAYFLSSQNFSNGFRTTLSILLPSLVSDQFGHLDTGMAISLGALAVSLSDAPGPVQHRRNAMLATVVVSVGMTLLTGVARLHPISMTLEIGLLGFFFSMFVIYGNRATSVGTAALLTMILMLDRPLDLMGILRESGLIAAGGLWYTAIGLLSSRLRPYQAARQALGQCIHAVATFMAIKADFYDISTPLDDDYRRLVAQQVVVSEQQDAVREILFKSRQLMAESDNTSRLLVLTFTDVVDLYDQILAMYLDYADMLERFGQTGVLPRFAALIRKLSIELDYIGLSIQASVIRRPPIDISKQLDDLWQHIEALGPEYGSTLVLRKAMVGLRAISQRLSIIQNNISQPAVPTDRADTIEYGRFVSHQVIDWPSFRNNLTRESSAFRHSVRVAVSLVVGYLLTLVLPYGDYSYWVLLTVLVILKPAFSLTKQRNIERITGTLAGAIIGVLILMFVPDKAAQFAFLVLFMLGTYSFLRFNYLVMVVCVTPFLLIVFSFLGTGYLDVAGERFLDTLLGGLLAFGASYLLFPNWESNQIVNTMREMLSANIRYMNLLLDGLSGKSLPVVDYKLVRKEVYVASANLAAAFQRMTSEPKHKQRNETLIYEFVVLNHILSANIATLITGLLTDRPRPYSAEVLKPIKRAAATLTDSQKRLLETQPVESAATRPVAADTVDAPEPTSADLLFMEHLQFIQQVSGDIGKVLSKGNWVDHPATKNPDGP